MPIIQHLGTAISTGLKVGDANPPISTGLPFSTGTPSCTYAEFQSNGSILLCQNLYGEWKYDLSTPYNISSSSISYKSGSARYWTIGQYHHHYYGNSNWGNQYGARVARFDYDNDIAAWYYTTGRTEIYEDLDVYTQATPTLTSTSTNYYGGTTQGQLCYLKKSNGGIVILHAYKMHTTMKMIIRDYSNDTTSTVNNSSEFTFSSALSNVFKFQGVTISPDGTKISLSYNETYPYPDRVANWTLSTPFDLTTASSVTIINSNPLGLANTYGITFVNPSWGSRVLQVSAYGGLASISLTTDGDFSTGSYQGIVDREDNMGYHQNASYGVWFDDGKKIIDQGFATFHYVYDSTSNPYGWKFHDMDPPNRTSNYTEINNGTSKEGQTFSDGRFNGNKSKLYGVFHSSQRIRVRNLSTPGDITTLNSTHSSEVNFTGWSGSHSDVYGWYDKLNNKFHMVDIDGSNNPYYYIFNLDSSGELDGTWNASPTGWTAGDFTGMLHLQPLSHNGKYFCHQSGTKCKIIFLDHAFEPARGYTAVTDFQPGYKLPNGTIITTNWWNRIYVASGRIFFTYHGSSYSSTLNMVYDITIGGVRPDNIT